MNILQNTTLSAPFRVPEPRCATADSAAVDFESEFLAGVTRSPRDRPERSPRSERARPQRYPAHPLPGGFKSGRSPPVPEGELQGRLLHQHIDLHPAGLGTDLVYL